MPYQVVNNQIPSFYNTDGTPLENGNIYIGTSGLNPENNQIDVYWDSALTQPAAQPIRTINGFPSRNGIPSRIYVSITDGAYSLTIKDRNGVLVFSRTAIDYILTDVTVGPVSEQIAIDAATASAAAIAAASSEANAASSEANAAASAASAFSSSQIAAASANIQWAGFSVTDGELIVSYFDGSTSLPSLVDGEFIITY